MCQGLVKVRHTALLNNHNLIRLLRRACGTPFAYNDSLHVDTERTRQPIFNDTRNLNWSLWTTRLGATTTALVQTGAPWIQKRRYSCSTIEATCYGNQGYLRTGCFGDLVNGVNVSDVSLLLVRLPSPPLVLSPFSVLRSCPTLRCCLPLLARAFRPLVVSRLPIPPRIFVRVFLADIHTFLVLRSAFFVASSSP